MVNLLLSGVRGPLDFRSKQQRHPVERCVADCDVQQVWLTVERWLTQDDVLSAAVPRIDHLYKLRSIVGVENFRQVFSGHISKYLRTGNRSFHMPLYIFHPPHFVKQKERNQ